MTQRLPRQVSQPRQTVVCVIGSGRSGTSAVAHLVQQLGVYFGPEEHLGRETAWNPEGCWEHLELMNMNLHLFQRLGGTDVAPPAFAPGWQHAPGLDDLRAEVRRIIAHDFSGQPIWGWKDPTLCLTLPFWQDLIGEMRYVICVRNPVDVIASLEKQWNWSLPSAINSWIERNLSSVLYTTGHQRLFFSFDDYFQSPEEHVRRLAHFIGRPLPEAGTEAHRRIFGTLKSQLRNFASPVEKVMQDERLTEGDKHFYQQLRSAASGDADVDTLALVESYRGAMRGRYQTLRGYFQEYATQSEAELAEARAALDQANARRDGFSLAPSTVTA